MTMPYERKRAVIQTEEFLRGLCRDIPRVPKAVREEARRLLRHYPSAYYMDEAAEQCPGIFGEWKSEK